MFKFDKQKLNSIELRKLILKKHYKVWKMVPANNYFTGINAVIDLLKEEENLEIQGESIEHAVNSLIEDGLLECKEVKNKEGNSEILTRITEKGRNQIEESKKHFETRLIAITGVIIALASLIYTIFFA